jgi:hypothetical protein
MKLPWDATNHVSPNASDRTVPIVVYAPGVKPRIDELDVSPLQVSATLAGFLGIPPPRDTERTDPLPGVGLDRRLATSAAP